MRDRYGAGPLHLMAAIASLAIIGYGLARMLDVPDALNALIWLAAAVIAHDLIAFPLYSLLSRIAFGRLGQRAATARVPAVNHLRVPALISALMLVVWFPLIFELSDRYEAVSGLPEGGFAGRWALLTAALFALSGLLYALRLRRASPAAG